MKNKWIALLCVCGLLLILNSELKAFDWGFKFGLSRVGYIFSDKEFPVDFESRSEVAWCAFLDFHISKNFAVQPEIFFNAKKGGNFISVQGWLFKHMIHYIEFPVLLKYKIPLKGRSVPEVFFGPYYGIEVESEVINIWDNWSDFMIDHQSNLEEAIQDYDYGLVLGGSIELQTCFVTLVIDALYNLGLANILKDSTDYSREVKFNGAFDNSSSLKNRAFLIMFGMSF